MQLPDREFYSLQSLAKRWKCEADDILEWCRMQLLVPAVGHGSLEVEVYEGPTPYPDLDGGVPLDEHQFVARYVEPPGLLFLPLFPAHIAGPAEEGGMLDLSECVLSSSPRDVQEWLVPVGAAEAQPLTALRIHRAEVERFEIMFGGDEEKPPTSRAINNALVTVAILAQIIAVTAPDDAEKKILSQTPLGMKKGGTFGSGLKPNINAIANLVLEQINKLGIDVPGQSSSAIRGRISEGLKLVGAHLADQG